MAGEIPSPQGGVEESPAWSRAEITQEQFGGSDENLRKRKKLLIHARPLIPGVNENPAELFEKWGINESEKKLLQDLNLKGDENILGIGCGNAALELYLKEHDHHYGMITGVDLNAKLFHDVSEKIADYERRGKVINMALLEWDGESLPTKWSSLDVAIASRVLHHTPLPTAMINEALRVLKPGGRLAAISRGPLNFYYMFEYAAALIAPALNQLTIEGDQSQPKYPGLLAASSWYDFGIVEAANEIPPMGFRSLQPFMHGAPEFRLEIPAEGWEDYLEAFATLGDSFKPKVSEEDMKAAITKLVKPRFDREVEKSGYFIELVDESIEIFEKIAA